MSNPANNHKINYIEFAASDLNKVKKFYSTAFGWTFEDWGPDYISFSGGGIDGGFYTASEVVESKSPLVVLYSTDLAKTQTAIESAGGAITVPIFDFPGGRRFHFSDGAGNQLAAWSE